MKLLSLAFSLALLACGGNKPASSPPSSGDPSSGDPSAPVANPGPGGGRVPCEQEIALQCDSGVDGCLSGQTKVHVCVPADEAAGPPCEQEIAKVCPDGQVDGCLETPPVSASHICVYKQ